MKTLSVALGALLLTACGTAAAPTVTVTAPASTVTAAPAPAPDPPAYSDGDQIRELLATQGFTYGGPSSDLEDVGNSICEAIDSGISPELLVRVAMDSGFTMDEGAALVAASILTICPWNENAV